MIQSHNMSIEQILINRATTEELINNLQRKFNEGIDERSLNGIINNVIRSSVIATTIKIRNGSLTI